MASFSANASDSSGSSGSIDFSSMFDVVDEMLDEDDNLFEPDPHDVLDEIVDDDLDIVDLDVEGLDAEQFITEVANPVLNVPNDRNAIASAPVCAAIQDAMTVMMRNSKNERMKSMITPGLIFFKADGPNFCAQCNKFLDQITTKGASWPFCGGNRCVYPDRWHRYLKIASDSELYKEVDDTAFLERCAPSAHFWNAKTEVYHVLHKQSFRPIPWKCYGKQKGDWIVLEDRLNLSRTQEMHYT